MAGWPEGDILDVFARGEDVYVYTQKRLGLANRQSGKTVVLGLGFGMGHVKFVDHAAKDNVVVSLAQSKIIVDEWRAANSQIQSLWWRMGDVALGLLRDFKGAMIELPQSTAQAHARGVQSAQRLTCLMTMLLPSGRRLYFRHAGLVYDPDRGRDAIVYDGVDDKRISGGRSVRGARSWRKLRPRRPRAMSSSKLGCGSNARGSAISCCRSTTEFYCVED